MRGAAKHWISLGFAALACAVLPQAASAGGGHGHGHGHGHSHGGSRFYFGFGPYWWGPPAVYWGPRYYAYPYPPVVYGAPYPVVVPPRVIVQEPPVYIERGSEAPGTWYYCESAGAYYPEVESCDEPWIRVPARD